MNRVAFAVLLAVLVQGVRPSLDPWEGTPDTGAAPADNWDWIGMLRSNKVDPAMTFALRGGLQSVAAHQCIHSLDMEAIRLVGSMSSRKTLNGLAVDWATLITTRALELQTLVAEELNPLPTTNQLYQWRKRYVRRPQSGEYLRRAKVTYNITARGLPCLNDHDQDSDSMSCKEFHAWERLAPAVVRFHWTRPWERLRRARSYRNSTFKAVIADIQMMQREYDTLVRYHRPDSFRVRETVNASHIQNLCHDASVTLQRAAGTVSLLTREALFWKQMRSPIVDGIGSMIHGLTFLFNHVIGAVGIGVTQLWQIGNHIKQRKRMEANDAHHMLVNIVAQRIESPEMFAHRYHRFTARSTNFRDNGHSRLFRKFQDAARMLSDSTIGTDMNNCPGRMAYALTMIGWLFEDADERRAQYDDKCYYWELDESASSPAPPNEKLTLHDPAIKGNKILETLSFLYDYTANSFDYVSNLGLKRFETQAVPEIREARKAIRFNTKPV